MDKRVIFAVAGSGKTSLIIDKVDHKTRCLIITYTENNFKNLKQRVLKKLGYIPAGVQIYTYFTFLYAFCFKPLLGHKVKVKGISWDTPPQGTLKLKRSDHRFYITSSGRLYHNRIAKLFEQCGIVEDILTRIEKYFDYICIDEVQDFGGHDFNLLTQIASANVNQLLVGDFYQHTFDTSRDGTTNKNLHNCYSKYQQRFINSGFAIDTDTLSNSHRCSSTVCDFVKNNIGIEISSHRDDPTNVEFVDCDARIAEIFACNETVKLFYQASYRYPGTTDNWGATKGEDHYTDVCVVLNATTMKKYTKNELNELPPSTKNKLYVACTRANRNLYLISEKSLLAFKI